MNEFGLKEPHHLYIIDLVACTISAIASLVMVYFCLRIPSENRAASIKFIFAVALSDFFYSFGNGMAVFQNSPEIYCNIEGFFRHTALVFSSLFAACTAIVSYGTSLSPKMTKAKTYLFYLLIFGFVFFGGLALFG